MLVLSRRLGESIVLPDCQATITVLAIHGNRIRLGVTASPDISVHRTEVWTHVRGRLARRPPPCRLRAKHNDYCPSSAAKRTMRKHWRPRTIRAGCPANCRRRQRGLNIRRIAANEIWCWVGDFRGSTRSRRCWDTDRVLEIHRILGRRGASRQRSPWRATDTWDSTSLLLPILHRVGPRRSETSGVIPGEEAYPCRLREREA